MAIGAIGTPSVLASTSASNIAAPALVLAGFTAGGGLIAKFSGASVSKGLGIGAAVGAVAGLAVLLGSASTGGGSDSSSDCFTSPECN